MSEQITIILKRKLDELTAYGEISAETRYNAFKEELQFYVLNFIYHHPEYSKWIMYGGSALRIIHGLDRMSVDLDFEVSHPITNKFLEELAAEVKNYFSNTYNAGDDFLKIKITNSRGLLLKFYIENELSSGHPSKQLHVKIDLNYFVAPKTVVERRPINRGQLSFVILTYNMGALMASKIAAIFLRGTRGVGEALYEEKGRDIYDLLWYMGKKIVPDFGYLVAKRIDIKDLRALFNKLTLQMNKVNNENLKNDLSPLFVDQTFIKNWLANWFESYFRLLDDYRISTITTLDNIQVHEHFQTDNFSFTYTYNTEDGKTVIVRYILSDYWVNYSEKLLPIKVDEKLNDKIKFTRDGWSSVPIPEDKLKQYITLFYQKTENYFKKTNQIMIGHEIITKVIRMTAVNLNPKEQIVLDRSTLISCELDDLLK
jgi:hypothetical protein